MKTFNRVVAWALRISLRVIFPFTLIDSYVIELLRNKLLGIDTKLGSEEWYIKDLINLQGDAVFVDVGAGVGQWSLWACPEAKLVVALEPNRAAFLWLLRHTKGYKNIVALRLAAWSRSGWIDSWVELGLGSTSFTVRSTNERDRRKKRIAVRAVKLDELIRSLKLSMENIVLKIDVEGAELEVLEGAADLLSEARVVILEVHQPNVNQKIQWLNEKFRELGYDVLIVRIVNDERRRHIVASRFGFRQKIEVDKVSKTKEKVEFIYTGRGAV